MKQPHEFLEEDLGSGDITTEAIASGQHAIAVIIAKEDCVVAGMEVAAGIFRHSGLQSKILVRDGTEAKKGTLVMEISGSAAALLSCERLALNFIQRLSGIATVTRKLVNICKPLNPKLKIAATRKTTPGLRKWEKDAVELGGGVRHREGLYDQFLIKDNHLRLAGSITAAINKARNHTPGRKIEVEVTDLAGAEEAVRAGADIIMLDNMKPAQARKTAARIRELNRKIVIEISGGITPKNIHRYAEFADVISLGWLTHSVKAIDYSLEIVEFTR
ncbi:MAG: carboxylating nicotinate-nucleotide diphosphorylase [Thermoplasmata archaeon]|nr:carboxylating nicotinate-nucleotide diphosphorylase [Thermoplasmata archaeon]